MTCEAYAQAEEINMMLHVSEVYVAVVKEQIELPCIRREVGSLISQPSSCFYRICYKMFYSLQCVNKSLSLSFQPLSLGKCCANPGEMWFKCKGLITALNSQ